MEYNLYILRDIHTGEEEINTASRMSKKLGVTTATIYNSVGKGVTLRGHYEVDIHKKAVPAQKNWDPDMVERWKKAVEPFARVQWIRDLEDGVKALERPKGGKV